MIETCNPEPKSVNISTECFIISLGMSFLLVCTPHFPLAIPASISLTFPTQAKQLLPLWKCASYLTLMHHVRPGAWTSVLHGDTDSSGKNICMVYGPKVEARFNMKVLHLFVFYRNKKEKKQIQVHMEKGENIPRLSNFISHPEMKPHCQVEICLLHGNLTNP